MKITKGFNYIDLGHFEIQTLELESKVLVDNHLNDPSTKRHILLVPKNKKDKCPVVFILSGFSSTGPGYFNIKWMNEDNFPQMIDSNFENIPQAVYVFVDASSSLGGSQFLNSPIVGRYEDHIVEELSPIISSEFCDDHNLWAIFGGSSGGYGALQLASKHSIFKHVGAIAPDSFFETCYLPSIYKACAFIKKTGLDETLNLIQRGEVKDMSAIETVAMSACYCPKTKIELPVDLNTGILKKEIWDKWKEHDPVVFLEKRKENLKTLKSVFLECGKSDEFSLGFGTYRIWQILKEHNFKLHYEEFEGGHFDISKRRLNFLSWLKNCL